MNLERKERRKGVPVTISRSTPTQAVGILVAAIMALGGVAVDATTAHADAFGEVAKVGKFGKGLEEFHWPIDLAVNPEEGNSVFVVDSPEGASAFPGAANLRVQKFASTLGPPVANAMIPVPEESTNKLAQYVSNIAVDPALNRLYVLKNIKTGIESPTTDRTVASEIDVYSTDTLTLDTKEVPPSGVFYTFPKTPVGGPIPSEALRDPHGLAIEQGTHNLLVLGVSEGNDTVIQRIDATGTSSGIGKFSEEYVDTDAALEPTNSAVNGIASGPGGVIYVGGHVISKAASSPGVVKLSTASTGHSLANPEIGLLHGEEPGESPPLTGGSRYASGGSRSVGEQLATSPDGTVVYAPAMSEKEEEEEAAGSYEVRGISTATGSQQIVYGGELTGEACHIESEDFAIAAGNGGVVYALDEAWQLSPENPFPYGFHLIEFGPGGRGCPAPATSLAINGNTESNSTAESKKGTEVELEASSSELKGAAPTEVTWELAGPEKSTTKVTTGCPACLTLTHRFLKTGLYTVTVSMTVTGSGFGPPPPVTRKVEVTALPPTASFEVSDLSSIPAEPKSGESVSFNAEGSFDPEGGQCSEARGCPATHELKRYTWNFGDGSPEVTIEGPEGAKVTHTFANASSQPLPDTVTLTVTNDEEVQSAAEQHLAIQGTADEHKEVIKEPIKEVPIVKTPIGPPPPPPPPGQKPPTTAQKLAKALKACKKIKAKGKRVSCEKQARRKYMSKQKRKHKRK
jgi:hypothetical protein